MDIVLAILIGGSYPQRIIGMLRLNDTHLIKVILGAIAFSSILLFIGLSTGMVDGGHVSIKSSNWGVVFGGLLLGTGFAIAGYCPGTGLCALGVGRRDAIWFILGGLLGALLFTLLYDVIKDAGLLTSLGGKVSLAVTGSKYESLVDSGFPLALGIAMALGAITWFLPERILK
jgi:hypothetical protein